ncbi:hypothetical protein P186_0890 [Pyrobaculum ferrireducens]|uniref:Uncharacterized protein n=2 Tax=Pyrobaculum ferrireducens TaxID=1104324 RepID=G7VB21_9CREN|nr:hypothetical protein P186_0890 [Pyrobaculum ferrireducens]
MAVEMGVMQQGAWRPRELRPLEISAAVRAPPRVLGVWEEEEKPRVRELDESLA